MESPRNALGNCKQCKGRLLTKGDKICCGQCGLPVYDHPLAARLATPAGSTVMAEQTMPAPLPPPVEVAAPFTVGPALSTVETSEDSQRRRGHHRDRR